jgi:hypothetical protein
MFIVDAAVLLSYPPHVVLRVVERVAALPRWCAGLRRVRHPDPATSAGCLFTYATADRRLTLRARTAARAEHDPPGLVRHVAEGDGVVLGWSFTVETEPSADGAPRTRLRARTSVETDPDHPTAEVRAAICRQLARRAPADLERLRMLLDRYEYGKAHAVALTGVSESGEPRAAGAPIAPGRAAQ